MAEKKVKAKKEGQGKGLLLLIILILNIFSMGAIGFLQYQAMEREKNRPSVYDLVKSAMSVDHMAKEDGELEDGLGGGNGEEDGILLPLNGFTANLAADDGPRRFIRLNTVLKFSLDSEEGEFRSRRPQIRDSIISILNSKKPGDLLKKEGKEYLKEEIKSAINAFLVDGRVVDVYYVGFQIN